MDQVESILQEEQNMPSFEPLDDDSSDSIENEGKDKSDSIDTDALKKLLDEHRVETKNVKDPNSGNDFSFLSE